jgi:Ni/Co efflux regulator RcnB
MRLESKLGGSRSTAMDRRQFRGSTKPTAGYRERSMPSWSDRHRAPHSSDITSRQSGTSTGTTQYAHRREASTFSHWGTGAPVSGLRRRFRFLCAGRVELETPLQAEPYNVFTRPPTTAPLVPKVREWPASHSTTSPPPRTNTTVPTVEPRHDHARCRAALFENPASRVLRGRARERRGGPSWSRREVQAKQNRFRQGRLYHERARRAVCARRRPKATFSHLSRCPAGY